MGLFSSQLSLKQLAPLCRQWATAHEAGISMLASLELLQRRVRNRRLRGIIGRIADRIKEGGTLADSLRSESKYFPPLMIETVHAGEVSGQLDKVLKDLAQYFEDRREALLRMLGLYGYLVLLLLATWFIGTFALMLIGKVAVASGPVKLDSFAAQYAWFHLYWLCIFGLVLAGIVFLARMGIWKWVWGAFSTFVWPVSSITKKLTMARYCRCLGLLIEAGVPITVALERAAAAAGNPYIERDLLEAIPPVRQGMTLTQAYAGSRYMTATALHMLEVGEESGNMEIQLRKVSEWNVQEAELAAKTLSYVVYIAAYLVVGLIVLLVLLSFYSTYLGRF